MPSILRDIRARRHTRCPHAILAKRTPPARPVPPNRPGCASWQLPGARPGPIPQLAPPAEPILADGKSKDKGEARAREYMPYPDPFQFPALRDVRGAQLAEFLERDVMPAIAGRYRALTGASNSALWGDSCAGAAALYIAMHHPLLFDRMIVESPSFIVGNGQLLRGSESLIHVPSRIALGIGTSEVPESEFPGFNSALVRMMGKLADNLKAVAWSPPQIQLTVTEGGRHTHATSEGASPPACSLSTERHRRPRLSSSSWNARQRFRKGSFRATPFWSFQNALK